MLHWIRDWLLDRQERQSVHAKFWRDNVVSVDHSEYPLAHLGDDWRLRTDHRSGVTWWELLVIQFSVLYPLWFKSSRPISNACSKKIWICVAGSKKKGLIRTYRSCPALTHNNKHDCGYMSKDILETASMQEQRNPNPDNTGKKLKERISPFSRCKMLQLCTGCQFLIMF